MTNTKPVAKSLHTITVIVQVARLRAPSSGASLRQINEIAIERAMMTLGLAGRPDPYGLAAKSLTIMMKGE